LTLSALKHQVSHSVRGFGHPHVRRRARTLEGGRAATGPRARGDGARDPPRGSRALPGCLTRTSPPARRHSCPRHLDHDAASDPTAAGRPTPRTGLLRVPIPGRSTSTSSPGCRVKSASGTIEAARQDDADEEVRGRVQPARELVGAAARAGHWHRVGAAPSPAGSAARRAAARHRRARARAPARSGRCRPSPGAGGAGSRFRGHVIADGARDQLARGVRDQAELRRTSPRRPHLLPRDGAEHLRCRRSGTGRGGVQSAAQRWSVVRGRQPVSRPSAAPAARLSSSFVRPDGGGCRRLGSAGRVGPSAQGQHHQAAEE
jgi:hypothetical protein